MTSCPGCLVKLEDIDGPTHRYIGASASCWDAYTRLLAGEPPIGPGSRTALLADAYAAQHPGDDSPQATQSVAVHLVVLLAVHHHEFSAGDLIALRQQAVAFGRRNGGYRQLLPAPSSWEVTIHDMLLEDDLAARTSIADRYPAAVLEAWSTQHADTIATWHAGITSSR